MLKVNHGDTGAICEICSKLTIKIPERRRSCVFIVNSEDVFFFNSEQIKPHSPELLLLAMFAVLKGTTTPIFLGIILAISSAYVSPVNTCKVRFRRISKLKCVRERKHYTFTSGIIYHTP